MTWLDRGVRASLGGPMPLFIFIIALVAGAFALQQTPREEEPQIVVPMFDILVDVSDIEAPEVERLVTVELEKLLAQIKGVEHIYSATQNGRLVSTLRFEVGHSREQALIDTYAKLYAYQDTMPAVVRQWQIKPIEVDDVAIVMLGLYSSAPQLYDDYQLTRMAQELATRLQRLEDTSEVKVITGRTRSANIYLDSAALNAHKTTISDVLYALSVANQLRDVGKVKDAQGHWRLQVQGGDALRSLEQLESLVVNVVNGQAVRLDSVASIIDGPGEAQHYQWLQTQDGQPQLPMVTLSVAKQAGANAVAVARDVHAQMQQLQDELLPPEVKVVTLRDYGQTANEKVNNLGASLVFAIVTVVLFIGVFLGWRPAIVIALALPICYGLTLSFDWAFGYTINRVTLFALILALGLLVDDPITGIDNISRFFSHQGSVQDRIVGAMAEIRTPLLMSTLTIMVAFFPLAFITGMMGPYMAPMAFNVPISVALSTLVAFFVTPWLAMKILKPEGDEVAEQAQAANLYTRMLDYLLLRRSRAKLMLLLVLVLFVFSACLPLLRAVPLKLLPYDNKSEVQVLVDMPEGTSLEDTSALLSKVQALSWQLNEVQTIAAYAGQPSSMDFNGMVRGYYRRYGDHLGELRILLRDKTERQHQSHAVVLRLRQQLAPLANKGISIKVIEVPPGPPVLSTLVAEVYAEPFVSEQQHRLGAELIAQRLRQEPHVVEVDSTLERQQQQLRFVTDKTKAALSALSTSDVVDAIAVAVQGREVGALYVTEEAKMLPIRVSLPYAQRDQAHLLALQVKGQRQISQISNDLGLVSAPQPLVPLSEVGEFHLEPRPQAIMRKDLKRVIYVTAELNGRTPAEVIADISADRGPEEVEPVSWQQRSFFNPGGSAAWQLPPGVDVSFSGEGEWRITIDVFRDMGIAFAFALAAILVLLRVQTRSMSLSLIIMSAIPLTVIGIMPGFWLLNQFGERQVAGAPEPVLFTATAMIGMIALAGIVVRNSLILVEFINQARAQGMAIKEALVTAGRVRMRPVLLTAGTTLLGNIVIVFDPVFSGLAIAIIFGIIASTLFTLLVVPLVYYLVFADEEHTHAT
ncbi:efflux RND transporter permease subunit [Pseudoalteromonas sp. T1lg88]|uniref:efflux RND transporter permease subunit n=1 Tax=Pseudoalteromonas sp. T1lg88 TaxID=2077104 RepID=UPI000CF642E0|nr:efflux RND transporter permease subunit [Pseudoalteromonas sp. T1lg88]